ncbi:MAG TPA: flagellar motor protein MotB [Terracidiphilus sp.]|nr:flagellar motor protein MotB [Terracidiphilus sp.]
MRARVQRSRVSHDRWLVSYADFITLLFAFFVVLYASANADRKKQQDVSAAIDAGFRTLGIFPGATRKPTDPAGAAATGDHPVVPMNMVMGEAVLSAAAVKDDLERIRRDLTQALSDQVATHTVSIEMRRDGLVISLREAGFFASGSATPKPETLPTLRRIAARLGATPYDLRIEGHTDNVPIHNSEFDSNWELSSARATRIARLILDQKLIAPDRISAAGYAEFHPVATNDTPQGRAENRRVDLVVLPRTKIDFAAPAQAAPPAQTGAWRKITDE